MHDAGADPVGLSGGANAQIGELGAALPEEHIEKIVAVGRDEVVGPGREGEPFARGADRGIKHAVISGKATVVKTDDVEETGQAIPEKRALQAQSVKWRELIAIRVQEDKTPIVADVKGGVRRGQRLSLRVEGNLQQLAGRTVVQVVLRHTAGRQKAKVRSFGEVGYITAIATQDRV